MPPRNTANITQQHTVVLRPRRSSVANSNFYGLKQRYYDYASGSPPAVGMRVESRVSPPCIQSPRHSQEDVKTKYTGGGDLLVRFGVDSVPGRMVARILIALVLFQPVYIAYGMELEEQGVTVSEPAPLSTESSEPTSSSEMQTQEETSEEDLMTEVEEEEAQEEQSSAFEGEENSSVVGSEEAVNAEEGDGENEQADTLEDDEQVSQNEQSVTDADTDMPQPQSSEEDEAVQEDAEEPEMTEGDENVGDSSGASESTDEEVGEVEEEENSDETGVEDELDSSVDAPVPGSQGSDVDGSDEEAGTEDSEDGRDEGTDSFASTTPEATTTEPLIIAQNPTNKYVFGEGECTVVSDGEFYCIADGPQRQYDTGEKRVYAQKDREGDKEVYFFDGVEVRRITNNNYDDFAPVFDEETMRIVWHAMINDRLQVMVHELPTNTTRQITTTRENSSNPNIAGDIVVWQEWVETNWEIMMTDVDNNGQPFEIERLTDNAVHDMFPTVYNDLVTWQSERGAGWEVVVYDIHTKKKQVLEKDGNTKYENPRFVLLFDSTHDNGDKETVGYDLKTGDLMELGTKAKSVPIDPVTPRDETPEAVVREATSTPQIKIEGEDDGESGDSMVVVM